MGFNSVCLLSLLLAPASALVAHTLPLRTRAPAVARAAPAEMMLGSRSFGQLRKSFKLPTLPKGFGRGGIIKGSDGGDGAPPSDGATASSGDSDDEPGPLVQAWKNYESLLDEKPLLMKALTSFTGFAIGDILAQLFIQKCDPFDWARLFRLASFGFFVHGTTSHWFYGMLDGKIPGTSAKVVFSKVFIDQVRAVTANKASLPATPPNSSPCIISHRRVSCCVCVCIQVLWNPCFGVMFFAYIGMLEAKGIQYVIDKTRNDLVNAVTGSWKVWPLAHTINFRFVPSSQRVLYINTIQVRSSTALLYHPHPFPPSSLPPPTSSTDRLQLLPLDPRIKERAEGVSWRAYNSRGEGRRWRRWWEAAKSMESRAGVERRRAGGRPHERRDTILKTVNSCGRGGYPHPQRVNTQSLRVVNELFFLASCEI